MVKKKREVVKETWIYTYWRPMMGWLYFVVCAFDFILFPIILAAFSGSPAKILDWNPLTLRGAGMFHLAMLSIITTSAWGRTQEKLANLRKQLGFPDAPPSDPPKAP